MKKGKTKKVISVWGVSEGGDEVQDQKLDDKSSRLVFD